MGLADQQRLLARIATEPLLRARFTTDPAGVGAESGLTPDDIQALKHVPAGQLALFARSLQSKRLGEVRKLLPLTCRCLDPQAAILFQRYAAGAVPTGLHRHRQDALAFTEYLLTRLSTEPGFPDEPGFPEWLPDLLRYEAGWLRSVDPACRRHVERLHSAIPSLLQSLERGETPASVRRPTLAVWWRFPRNGVLRHRIVSLPCVSLLFPGKLTP